MRQKMRSLDMYFPAISRNFPQFFCYIPTISPWRPPCRIYLFRFFLKALEGVFQQIFFPKTPLTEGPTCLHLSWGWGTTIFPERGAASSLPTGLRSSFFFCTPPLKRVDFPGFPPPPSIRRVPSGLLRPELRAAVYRRQQPAGPLQAAQHP